MQTLTYILTVTVKLLRDQPELQCTLYVHRKEVTNQQPDLEAKKEKSKTTLFSETFKAPKSKVLSLSKPPPNLNTRLGLTIK